MGAWCPTCFLEERFEQVLIQTSRLIYPNAQFKYICVFLLTAGTGPADVFECTASGKSERLFSHFAEHQKPHGTLLHTENSGDVLFLNHTLFINPYSRSTLCQVQPQHRGFSKQRLSVPRQGFKHNRKLEYNNIRSIALKIPLSLA